jgi:hypothetical protein
MVKFPLHCGSFQRSGQVQAEALKQDLWVLGGLADASPEKPRERFLEFGYYIRHGRYSRDR